MWRLYSMTKPITSVAAMILYEEGRIRAHRSGQLVYPVLRRRPGVRRRSDLRQVTVPAAEPVRIWHLLSHTAALVYGFHRVHPVDAMYRAAGFELVYARRRRPGRGVRHLGWHPASLPARYGVELLGGNRRARPGDRGRVRAAS